VHQKGLETNHPDDLLTSKPDLRSRTITVRKRKQNTPLTILKLVIRLDKVSSREEFTCIGVRRFTGLAL
jgi:hypothetical protein